MGSHGAVTKGQLFARLLLILSCEALATSAHLIVLPREASCSDTCGFPIRAVACSSSLSLFVWLCNFRKLERQSTSSSNSVFASGSCEEELEQDTLLGLLGESGLGWVWLTSKNLTKWPGPTPDGVGGHLGCHLLDTRQIIAYSSVGG